ncbi:MAG: universal stress protein [Gemmatimonadales bacterium]|nr:MAG: universal stress protein [Gemmatimonadales bacterium]
MYPVSPTPEAKVAGTLHSRGPVAPLGTILVGTDLSDGGRSALRAAAHLVPSRPGNVHVVHVQPAPDRRLPAREDSAPESEGVIAADQPSISDPLSQLAQQIQDSGLADRGAHPCVCVGRPFQVITALAEEVAANLIVLGRHRPRRAFDGLLGSTAERVVRTAAVPCLVVNREIEATPRRIMVATDLSPHGEHAGQVAVTWAKQWAGDSGAQGAPADGRIHVQLVSIADFARPGYRPLRLTDTLRSHEKAASETGGDAVEVTSRVVSYPLAPEGILKIAEELEADLVFMGTHGYGPVLRHLFGSVTSEVIRTLPLPVVVVPLPVGR